MKKSLPTDTVIDDLEGSPFFKRRSAPDPERDTVFSNETAPIPPAQATSAVTERPNGRTTERRGGRRIITRNSFEIYEDQMQSLRRLAYREKMDGKLGSMSQMVRDAIDRYLAEHKSPGEE